MGERHDGLAKPYLSCAVRSDEGKNLGQGWGKTTGGILGDSDIVLLFHIAASQILKSTL